MSIAPSPALPPHHLVAERSVLGAVLLDERHLHGLLVEEQLRPEHFYNEHNGAIFTAMLELYNTDHKIDHLTVAEALQRNHQLDEIGGPEAIEELASWVPATGNAREYGRIVREHAQMRSLLKATYDIQAGVLQREAPARDLIERAERAMLEVAQDERQKSIRSIADILHEETDRLHHRSLAHSPLTGTPSGFKDLDDMTGGFQAGNLIIVAARPSMGKSALVANVAENAALANHAVALFSLEMSEAELAQRFVASQARVKGEELRRGRVAESRWPKILQACQRLGQAPLFIDDSSDTGVLEVRAKSRRIHHQLQEQGGLGLIIVDYLQLMRHEGKVESRVEQVGQISRGLKSLARELGVPVIALSQLSRAVEQRGGDKKPILSDLRECVTGETLVLLADGSRRPIRELVGSEPIVLALDERHRVISARSDAVWCVGRRPVLRVRLASGRMLRATREHRILAGAGWRRMGDLVAGDRVALARRLPEPSDTERWPDDRVVLLGQMIGDGSSLAGQPMRSHEKRIPESAFRLPNDQIALLLRHMWATDGSIWAGIAPRGGRGTRVDYATKSDGLARDVAALLLRLGIVARIGASGRPDRRMWSVTVSGDEDQRRFLDTVGAFGPWVAQTVSLGAQIPQAGTGVDTLPVEVCETVRSSMAIAGISQRATATARSYAEHLQSPELVLAAEGDVVWDRVVAVEEDGNEDVFDLTVPGPHSWLADGIVSHNSGQIEQDADLVMFIYRDEYYTKEDSERPGEADIIIAKHRNGPVGDVTLTFQREYPRFMNYGGGERFAA